jgi:hypothetical protein
MAGSNLSGWRDDDDINGNYEGGNQALSYWK